MRIPLVDELGVVGSFALSDDAVLLGKPETGDLRRLLVDGGLVPLPAPLFREGR
jgi:hypothetical protein